MERAQGFACLVDAAAYYRRLHQVLQRARHSILLVGWDFDSRVSLVQHARTGGPPARFGAFLDHLVRTREDLVVNVLAWKGSSFFARERQLGLRIRLGWNTHPRVRFRYDRKHPFGGSQHQKIVVVDDVLAFSGGLDITRRRWDTPEHRPLDRRRRDQAGEPYAPFHDVQALVSGEAAAALGVLVRERWRRVSGERLPEPRRPGHMEELWPADLVPDLVDVPVALARTQPSFGGLAEVREVERSFLESIRSAQGAIYAENQYFTSPVIASALAERLREADGPEVILVMPRRCTGWVEKRTLGRGCLRVLHQLREADRHGRLRALYPQASRERRQDVFVHSKVLCIDDELLRIGSANWNARSMGLDSECDLLALAEGEHHRRGIRRVREHLLAEHLGVPQELVSKVVSSTRSLATAIEELGSNDRTLAPLEIPDRPPRPFLIPADLSRPLWISSLIEQFLEELGGPRRTWPGVARTLLPFALLGTAWALAPESWRAPATLERVGEAIRSWPLDALAAAGTCAVGLALVLPASRLVLFLALVLGPASGLLVGLGAALVAALLCYAAGRSAGGDRLSGWRQRRLARKLRGRGARAVTVLRLLPLASEGRLSLACGAAAVPWPRYLVGTAAGLLPGAAAGVLVAALVRELVQDPGRGALVLLLAVTGALIGAAAWFDRQVADHRFVS